MQKRQHSSWERSDWRCDVWVSEFVHSAEVLHRRIAFEATGSRVQTASPERMEKWVRLLI